MPLSLPLSVPLLLDFFTSCNGVTESLEQRGHVAVSGQAVMRHQHVFHVPTEGKQLGLFLQGNLLL